MNLLESGYWTFGQAMGPGGTYRILSKGGVDRGGVTSYLPSGVPPHWLPYVAVDDVDATITRAICMNRGRPCETAVGYEDVPSEQSRRLRLPLPPDLGHEKEKAGAARTA